MTSSRRSIADLLQTCRRLVGNYNLYPNMDIKWLHKSHRSPVSCIEISREQVANRLPSRCKQGFSNLFSLYFVHLYFLFIGFKSGNCLLIAPVPVHCFSITFTHLEILLRELGSNYLRRLLFSQSLETWLTDHL